MKVKCPKCKADVIKHVWYKNYVGYFCKCGNDVTKEKIIQFLTETIERKGYEDNTAKR